MSTASVPAGPLRLVHVDTETGFSGGEVQVVGLVEGLRRRGHEQTVVGPADGRLAARGRELGWTWRDGAARNDLDWRFVRRLARLLVETRAQVVHLHTGRAAWLGAFAARLARVPAVVTRRQDKRLSGSLKHRLLHRHLAAASIGISPGVRDQLLAAGARPGRTAVVRSSVDPDALRPSAPRSELRAAVGADEDDFVVASAARLTHRKGLDLALDALGLLSTRRPVLLVIAGDGPERAELERRAARLAGPHHARLVGALDAVGDLLGAADAFVLPSRAEGLGVAALEAMAVGLPVVATEVGGLGEAVGACGLRVPPEDPAALARAFDRLADEPGTAAALGAAAAERVRTTFAFAVQVERYERLYRRVAAGDPEPALVLAEPDPARRPSSAATLGRP